MFPVWVLFHGFGFALLAVVFVSANLPCSHGAGTQRSRRVYTLLEVTVTCRLLEKVI